MPATKVIKTKPVEATRKTLEKTKPVKVTAVTGAHTGLKVPPVRKSRASSCPRCPRRDGTGAQRPAAQTSCGRRTRSSSTAPGLSTTAPGLSSTAPGLSTTAPGRSSTAPGLSSTAPGLSSTAPGLSSTAPGLSSTAPGRSSTWPRANPDCRKAQREQRGVRAQTTPASQSHKAFTVIPPDPKKRREIQRKAEAELAALEELRLSRAMAYVSINPSSVGGCMSLEEVRSKQQQEMMQAKRKPMKTQAMEQTPVLRS